MARPPRSSTRTETRAIDTNDDARPAWRRHTEGEHRLPVGLAIAVVIALQWVLPDRLTPGPRWLFPAIEAVLVVVLHAADPGRIRRDTGALRMVALGLIGVVSLGTVYSVAMLVHDILTKYGAGTPGQRLFAGGGIYLMNILTFAVWFWELDRGGPAERARGTDPHPDFLFPPMTAPELVHQDWEPGFVDYLYLAFTNATAFSPTDTLPLSRWAKVAMALESGIALALAALVIAKAVNALQ